MKVVKKLLYNILCNDFTGSILKKLFKNKIPDIRWPKYRFEVKGSGMKDAIVASIFWGFYEGAEIRFIEKYFKGDTDVVELGASSGIISSHLLSKLSKGRKLIAVEANTELANVWKENVRRHNTNDAVTFLVNKAVHYSGQNVLFAVSQNTTESRVLNNSELKGKVESISTVKLQTLVEEYQVDHFSLFCDIEGAEIEILKNDADSLKKCKNIFIELHDTEYNESRYTTIALQEMILNLGFRQVDQYGHVYYFQNEN